MDKVGVEYLFDTSSEFNNTKENLCQGQSRLRGPHYIRHFLHQPSLLIPQQKCEFFQLTLSKDMSGRRLALKSILTSKQVHSWSLLGWTPACFQGQLQHHLIPHSSTSLCSPSSFTLYLWDSHNVMTYTYRYRGDTGAKGKLSWIIIIVIEGCLLGLEGHPTESRKRERKKKREKRARKERW